MDFNELIFILLGSLALTLTVELPVKNLRHAIFKRKAVMNTDQIFKNKVE